MKIKNIKVKKLNNSGAAMILVICIMALISVLSMSLLLASATVMTSASKELAQNQSRIMAVSLSQQLGDEITDKNFQSVAEEQENKDGSLWYYLKEKLTNNTWPYFNEDEKGHTEKYAYRYFRFDQEKISSELRNKLGELDSIRILMYWESYSDAEMNAVPLTIKVICEKNNEKCTITSQYVLNCNKITSVDGSETYEQWKWILDWRA